MSTALELAGLGALIGGAYELAGRGFALIALAAALLFLGVATDGLDPWPNGRRRLRAAFTRLRKRPLHVPETWAKAPGEPLDRGRITKTP